jgi:hypothetical protein
MTQALYAHMNNKRKKNKIKPILHSLFLKIEEGMLPNLFLEATLTMI